jgi:DNA-binding transcriptional MocR family regulator
MLAYKRYPRINPGKKEKIIPGRYNRSPRKYIAVNKIRFRVPDGGMAVWVQFDPGFDLSQLSGKAALHGLGMLDGTFYNSGTTPLNALRMGFASLNEEEMVNVVKILGKIMVS